MITWKMKIDGSWEYDYTIIDNCVLFIMDIEIKNQISCYSMIPWENKEVKIKAVPRF